VNWSVSCRSGSSWTRSTPNCNRACERLAAAGLGELASVFPALRSLRPAGEAPSTPVERFRAHRAVRELIERLAARRPLMLGLDDLHWSDGASLELFGHLVRRPPRAAVMVVVAFRTGQVDAGLVTALAAGTGEGVLTLNPGPRDRAAADALIRARGLGGREGLYRQSGGNPFHLLQLAREASAGARAASERRRPGVPAAVSAAITAELDRLPPSVRAFGQAAAVAGDLFELDLAVATAAMAEPEALAALDELRARDLVRPTEVPRRFQFRHPLVRSAVYESCSPGVRLTAHRRSADELAARGAPATTRAHHVEQSARHGDAAAIQQQQLRGGPRRLGARTVQRCALVRGRAAAAGVEQLLGRHADAHDRLEGALDQLPDRESAEGAALMIALALDAFYGMNYERMTAWSEEAVGVAAGLGDAPLHAAAAAVAAFAGTLRSPPSCF
jgi:hypothetical protein